MFISSFPAATRGISKFMRCLLTGYAVWYNRKYSRIGHLFQNRYKSIICEEDPYLLELVRYIHLNPLRAGVVQDIEQLEAYPWAGHSVLVGRFSRPWQETGYVLGHFSGRRRRAVQSYRKFIEEGKGQGRRPDLTGGGLVRSLGGWSQVLSLRDRKEKIQYDARILGGGDFVADVLKTADQKLSRQIPMKRQTRDAEEMIRRICQEEGIGAEEFRGGRQRRKVAEARGRISYILSRELGMPLAEIARRIGICTSGVFRAIEKVESSKKGK